MPDLISWCTNAWATNWATKAIGCSLLILQFGCSQFKPSPAIQPQVLQDWQLQPGDRIAGYTVTGGLGDISIALQGQAIYAPFVGEVQQDKQGCLFYRSAELPAYMFRLCGVDGDGWFGINFAPWNHLRLGKIRAGEVIGYAHMLQFATLRQQSNGQWAIVEPDKSLIETLLRPPPSEP
jgi:hypothetical protein